MTELREHLEPAREFARELRERLDELIEEYGPDYPNAGDES